MRYPVDRAMAHVHVQVHLCVLSPPVPARLLLTAQAELVMSVQQVEHHALGRHLVDGARLMCPSGATTGYLSTGRRAMSILFAVVRQGGRTPEAGAPTGQPNRSEDMSYCPVAIISCTFLA